MRVSDNGSKSDIGFNTETTQDMLVCFLWILKSLNSQLLLQILKRWSYAKIKKLISLLDLCVGHFEYKWSAW